jgi:hypothetical protein
VTISQEKLLRVYNPNNCLKHSSKLKTIQDVINTDTPSLSKINREHGTIFLRSFIITWVLYLNETLTLKRPLSESQIEMVSELIISDYSALKISDITFIFKNAISGKYGEFYESLTIPKVLSWFSDHFEQRCEIAEMMSSQMHSSFTNAEIVKWDSKVIEEMFKGISDTVTQKEKPIKINLPPELESSNGYIEQLKELSKELNIEKLKELILNWDKYPKYKMYQEVLENELKNREITNP